MDKSEIKKFFDEKAKDWDSVDETDADIVKKILDNADINGDVSLLDVACGTGVLIPFYLERGLNYITAIDISDEMIKTAQRKFEGSNVEFITGDIEETDLNKEYDRIVVYNAFPHFPEPERLIKRLCGLLKKGGILTIAHGKSREVIDAHHKGAAAHISRGLMSIEELEGLFTENVTTVNKVSDDSMYQIVVRKM